MIFLSRSIYIRKNGGKYMSLSKDENEEIGIPYFPLR